MSNTVITNYTDLNGPSTKADSSVVVIVNKDGSLSVDQNLLGTLMGTDGSQAAGISVVRVGHEGRPDDATDSESEDDKVPHVTLSVDSYYDEPNSIIKYDSGAEMLQSLRIETRENSLIGFQNDHCYTPFLSPSQTLPQTNESYSTYDEPVIEITHTPPPKPVPSSKKITILEQQIIPKGKKIVINSSESPVIVKGNDVLNKPLPILPKSKNISEQEKSENLEKSDDTTESSSITSGESIPDRDSDSDYKDTKDRSGSIKVKKPKLKPRILKSSKAAKLETKVASRLKANKNILKKEVKEKINKSIIDKKQANIDIESLIPSSEIPTSAPAAIEQKFIKSSQKPVKKEKKTPAHVSALLSDMTSLFSTPDVIRRVSTDNKLVLKSDTKELLVTEKKISTGPRTQDISSELKTPENIKSIIDSSIEKPKTPATHAPKTYLKLKDKTSIDNKVPKSYELTATIPQLDEASLAQILQDTSGISSNPVKSQPTISTVNTMNSPGLTGPLSPTLDLLGGLQPEEEGLTEDLLLHVAQLVESSENLQEVIDKQVLGKVDSTPPKPHQVQPSFQQTPSNTLYAQTLTRSAQKTTVVRKDPIEIVRRDGRVITLPPIEAPATRSSKRKSQLDTFSPAVEVSPPPQPQPPPQPVAVAVIPEPQVQVVSKQYTNKKLTIKKQEPIIQTPVVDKVSAESQESWASEDDPYRLWCICKQPHNNRFMICCDGCEDWFHGKCVNITKAMGQQMEEQGIEWRCPNCIKKTKTGPKTLKATPMQKKIDSDTVSTPQLVTKDAASKTSCIVCKKPARASSIYCSNACILKHAHDSLGIQTPSKPEETGKSSVKQKSDSRVIVYERKSGRLLAGPNAPTADNLKDWLQKNPTFEVVRPGTLSTIKPNMPTKKKSNEPNKIQTTLGFERIPRKSIEQPTSSKTMQPELNTKTQTPEIKTKTPSIIKTKMIPETRMKLQQAETKSKGPPERMAKLIQSPKEEMKLMPQPKTPVSTRSNPFQDSPKPSTSTPKGGSEPRKLNRSANRTSYEKAPSVSPSTSRRKDSQDTNRNKMDSSDSIRENVRKALQEQLSIRMAENTGSKFSEYEIQQFANNTEYELHELFRDVGMKYKAKYRSLMFNIKDRKNLSLWQKICERTITPKQLVRLSPEELASQELAQWRDQEVKHQLELIKKSELDMLAASKTYVLKTHKGEEVMQAKESVSTELDPQVPVEDLVTALNDSTAAAGEESKIEDTEEVNKTPSSTEKKYGSSRKRGRDDNSSEYSKKERRESKRDTDSRKSRSSRRKSEIKDKESKEERRSSRRHDRTSTRTKSVSRDRSREGSKEKSHEHSRYRSRSRVKSKRPSKSREHSKSPSRSRDRSRSRGRSRRRSVTPDTSKSKKQSRSKVRSSTEDKQKHRSRSQDVVYSKNKNDSTDSDSIERPKSAMLKEVHPEYDPHEPMITSAFSEEDLRKSRDDVYDNEIAEFGNSDFDASKSFAIDTNIIIPSPKYVGKQDKSSAEPESDQEPSSTVENSAAIVWNGCINMVDVARFYVAAHEASGSASDLEEDLSAELEIVGRINPDTVWDYINKMKRASNKDIVVLKLQAANDEEKMQYIALYSYLSSRNRLGVVKVSNTSSVKDIYVVPLPANTPVPTVLSPFDGPGLGEVKTHLLICIVIRQRKKRIAPHIPKEVVPEKVTRSSRKRSYTPPPPVGKGSYTPPPAASPRRRALPLPQPTYTSPALSTSVKDKIAASLACADDEEAYSPGSSSSGGSAPASTTLRSKMEELNRQIEEQKQQILKMARADSSVGAEDEAYSPSRPMTPPGVVPLADIALPSNLQEILATIKQRSEPTSDVDMRTLPLPP